MATEKQIAANRENAKRSTGPRTQAGKDIARRNAIVTGLAGLGFVKPEHLENEVIETIDWIHSTLKPDNIIEERFRDNIAFHLVCVRESSRMQVARKLMIGLRAAEFWDDDKLAEAAELAEELSKKPGAILRRLRGSKHGCMIVIERWGELDDVLARAGSWDEAQKSMALDLLGTSHAVRQHGTVLDVPEGVELTAHLRGIVRAEVAKLEERRDEFTTIDEEERKLAMTGNDPHDRAIQLLKRYGREHLNVILNMRREFGRIDRKTRAYVPTSIPQRRAHETRDDFEQRMHEFRLDVNARDEKARAEANAARLAANAAVDEEERLAALRVQPKWHEGLPLEVYFEKLREWHDRLNGYEKPTPPAAPDGDTVHRATCSEALPEPVPPAAAPRPEWPDDPDPTLPFDPEGPARPHDRHDE